MGAGAGTCPKRIHPWLGLLAGPSLERFTWQRVQRPPRRAVCERPPSGARQEHRASHRKCEVKLSQKQRNGPPPIAGRSESQAATTATDTTRTSLRRASVTAAAQRPNGTPLALASVFAPHGRRTWWWYSFPCRTCATYHFGRARELDQVTGQRKTACGHVVMIVAARVYGRPDSGAAT